MKYYIFALTGYDKNGTIRQGNYNEGIDEPLSFEVVSRIKEQWSRRVSEISGQYVNPDTVMVLNIIPMEV